MKRPRGVPRASLNALAPEAEMLRMKQAARRPASTLASSAYDVLLRSVSTLLEEARRSAARSVNAVMTATYWEIGRRIVTYEQRGVERAAYGEALLKRLSVDLTTPFGRGFSERNLEQMRLFYLGWPISQTPSAKSHRMPTRSFPLSWSHYVRLLSVEDPQARRFYETEALLAGRSGITEVTSFVLTPPIFLPTVAGKKYFYRTPDASSHRRGMPQRASCTEPAARNGA